MKSCKVTLSVESEVRPYMLSSVKRKVTNEECIYLFSKEAYADPVQFVEDCVKSSEGLWKEYVKSSKKDYTETSIHCMIETLSESLMSENHVFRLSLYHRYGKPYVMYLRPFNSDKQEEFRGEDNLIEGCQKLTPTLYSKDFFSSNVKKAAKSWIQEYLALSPKAKEAE